MKAPLYDSPFWAIEGELISDVAKCRFFSEGAGKIFKFLKMNFKEEGLVTPEGWEGEK